MNAHLIRRGLDNLRQNERQAEDARAASDAHRKAEDKARAQRLRGEWLIRTALRSLLAQVRAYHESPEVQAAYLSGRSVFRVNEPNNVAELQALTDSYNYLDTVPTKAFQDPV